MNIAIILPFIEGNGKKMSEKSAETFKSRLQRKRSHMIDSKTYSRKTSVGAHIDNLHEGTGYVRNRL